MTGSFMPAAGTTLPGARPHESGPQAGNHEAIASAKTSQRECVTGKEGQIGGIPALPALPAGSPEGEAGCRDALIDVTESG